MSTLWVLGLGASMGYLALKQRVIGDRLSLAVKEWEGPGEEPPPPQPPDASFKEIKDAWKYTADTRNRDFNERLPVVERNELLRRQDASARDVVAYDRAGQPPGIEGVYLEQSVPF
jgi:hypothetical protein